MHGARTDLGYDALRELQRRYPKKEQLLQEADRQLFLFVQTTDPAHWSRESLEDAIAILKAALSVLISERDGKRPIAMDYQVIGDKEFVDGKLHEHSLEEEGLLGKVLWCALAMHAKVT